MRCLSIPAERWSSLLTGPTSPSPSLAWTTRACLGDRILEGKIEDIYAENGFIVVKDADFPNLKIHDRIGI